MILSGNFGQAVSLAAKTAGEARSLPVNASVVLPKSSQRSKIAGARRNGARVVLAGSNPQDREIEARKIVHDTGATMVGPMDDRRIVLGQATTTLEMLDQVNNLNGASLDVIVLPSATGGLLTGAAIVCENSDTMVLGCEPLVSGPDLKRGISSGIRSRPINQTSVADGLRASTSSGNFELIKKKNLVQGFYTVEEEQIKQAWRMVLEELKLVIEPSSAVALALVLYNTDVRKMLARIQPSWNVGIILTGGNTTVGRIAEELGDLDACNEMYDNRRQAAVA